MVRMYISVYMDEVERGRGIFYYLTTRYAPEKNKEEAVVV